MKNYLTAITNLSELSAGTLLVRSGSGKLQQGLFMQMSEDGGYILQNVLDLASGSFVAEAGVIRPADGDQFFMHTARFATDPQSESARNVLKNWTLFKDAPPPLQQQMSEFVESAFSPAQILEYKSTDTMQNLFVPIQQKLKIGKFKEKIDWTKENLKNFKNMLAGMADARHITYVAFIPREVSKDPRFYSIGTKPHLEMMAKLKDEPFAFRPNQGGHIQVTSGLDETPKKFLVDAGSYDLGAGVHTSIATAELVSEGLAKLFPEYEFTPVSGQGAYGIQAG